MNVNGIFYHIEREEVEWRTREKNSDEADEERRKWLSRGLLAWLFGLWSCCVCVSVCVNCMNKRDGNGPGDSDVIHVKNCNNSLLIITFSSQLFIHMHIANQDNDGCDEDGDEKQLVIDEKRARASAHTHPLRCVYS